MSPRQGRTVDSAGPPRPSAPADPTGRGDSLRELLAEHCRQVGAVGGAVVRVGTDGRVSVVSSWPAGEDESRPAWLAKAAAAAGEVAEDAALTVRPLHEEEAMYGQPAARRLVLVPLPAESVGGTAAGSVGGVAAFVIDAGGPSTPEAIEQSVVSVGAVRLYSLELSAADRSGPGELADAMAVLAAVNEHDRFAPGAMALCNELASRHRCDRVSLGWQVGGEVRLAAMSHTERFSRKTRAVRLVEDACAECLDQDVEVTSPAGGEAAFVNRCARELSAGAGAAAVASLPLRRGGEPVAAVVLERAGDEPLTPTEIETVRLTCELCTPRLVDLRRGDRWLGAKAAGAARRGLAAIVGPRYTVAKLLAVLVAAAGVYMSLATGEYRIDAPFVLAASRRQVACAAFDGEIDEAFVRVGDEVKRGQPLAKLRTLPLQRKLHAARADLFESDKRADAARADKKWAEAQIAAARGRKLAEQVRLLGERIEQAELRARIDGTVVRGDLKRLVGASVRKGKELLEIAPLWALRAELAVGEDQVGDLLAAMRRGEVGGVLAAASYPGREVEFVVERVEPMGKAEGGEVTFTVRAALRGTHGWMRPGMAGVAHVRLERRRLAWIWTRELVNWLRLRLWM